MLALVTECFPAPQPGQDLQALVQQLRAYLAVRRLPDLRKAAIVQSPEAHRQHEPSVREVVERHRLPGKLPRPPTRRRRQHGPDAYPLGAHGHRRQHDPRVVSLHIADADAVPVEGPVPARLLHLPGKLGHSARISAGDDEAVTHARLLPYSLEHRDQRTRYDYTAPPSHNTTQNRNPTETIRVLV